MTRSDSKEQSFLQRGVRLEGQVETSGDLRIEGRVLGILNIGGTAIIGADAEAKGLIKGREVVVHGMAEGTIVAEQRIHLARGAKVSADLYCDTLVIDEGVFFHGRSHMGQPIPDLEHLSREMFVEPETPAPRRPGLRGTPSADMVSGKRVDTSRSLQDPGPPGIGAGIPGASATKVHDVNQTRTGLPTGQPSVPSEGGAAGAKSGAGASPPPEASHRPAAGPGGAGEARPPQRSAPPPLGEKKP